MRGLQSIGKMDIVEAFTSELGEATINIQGTPEEPLFQANQVAAVLGFPNIRSQLADLPETYKVVAVADTPGGPQQTTFLTEVGLYRLVMRSRKEIAKPFQEWVVNTLKELRINGVVQLREQLRQRAGYQETAREGEHSQAGS